MSHSAPTPSDDTGHRDALRGDFAAVLAMSLPVVVTTVSRTVMGFVDFWMVSKLGTEAQAAITPAALVVFSFISFGMGTTVCMNTFAAQALGRSRRSDASAYAWQALYLSVLMGLAALLLEPAAPWLFAWFGHDPAVQALETTYFRICLLSVGPSIAAAGLANFFIGIARPSVAMLSAVGANLFNVAANYVLIFGGFGWVEPMGIAGAAWGTVLATVFRAVWLLAALVGPQCAAVFESRRTWHPDLTRLRNLLRIGLPTSVQFSVDLVGWTLFVTWLVGQFGTADLAATNIVFQYLHLSFMPAVGVGIAINSLVGRAIGEGDIPTAHRRLRVGGRVSMTYMGLMGLLFFVFRYPLIAWFNADAEIVAIGARLMICAALFQVFDGMCITYNNGLRGAGDTLWPAAALVSTFGVIGLGGGYVLATRVPALGSLGPWIACTTFIVILGLLLRRRWWSERWRSIDIFREPDSAAELEAEFERA